MPGEPSANLRLKLHPRQGPTPTFVAAEKFNLLCEPDSDYVSSPAAAAYPTLCVTASATTCPTMAVPSRASISRLPYLRNRLLRLSSVPESPSRLLTLLPPLLLRRPHAAILGVTRHCAGAMRAQPAAYFGHTKDSLPIWFNPGIIKFQEMSCPSSARKCLLAAIDSYINEFPELDRLRSVPSPSLGLDRHECPSTSMNRLLPKLL